MAENEISPGPLAREWQLLRDLLERNHRRTWGEIELVRLVFYAGASCAVTHAIHSQMALIRMNMEIRDFDKECLPDDQIHEHREAV